MTTQQNQDNSARLRVAVVGATGMAGQQFLAALAHHPWMDVVTVAASARSAGKTYRDAITGAGGQLSWFADGVPDPAQLALEVIDAEALDPASVDLVFSCIDAEPARRLEARYAEVCPVISTASAFRMEADVPIGLFGVNHDHFALIEVQKKRRGFRGFVVPNPNCTTVGLAMTLAPLYRAFGIERVHVVSMQAISGAGRSPGVSGLDIIDNIVPFIPKEEAKVEAETKKILGQLRGEEIVPADFGIAATCTRVPIIEGHTEVVHVQLSRDADAAAITSAWTEHGRELSAAGYPSMPPALIAVHDDPFRPQVRLDRDAGDGLTTSVGRLRPDPTAPRAWKYMLVSHNTKMGAATGCILLAEHLRAVGLV